MLELHFVIFDCLKDRRLIAFQYECLLCIHKRIYLTGRNPIDIVNYFPDMRVICDGRKYILSR